MSCDLSDPFLALVYEEILRQDRTTWLVAGYHDTRDKISFYGKGPGGFSEIRDYMLAHDEVLYGLIRMDHRLILITYINDASNGVKRARALVHTRAVGHLFKDCETQVTLNGTNELDEAVVRSKIAPTAPSDRRPSSASPKSESPVSPARRPTDSSIPERPLERKPTQEIQPLERKLTPDVQEVVQTTPVAAPKSKPPRQSVSKPAIEVPVQDAPVLPEVTSPPPIDLTRSMKAAASASSIPLPVQPATGSKTTRARSATTGSQNGNEVDLTKVSGFITIHSAVTKEWKRRFFVFQNQQLLLFSVTGVPRLVEQIALREFALVSQAREEIIVANSLKLTFRTDSTEFRRRQGEPLLVYADDRTQMTRFMGRIQEGTA